MNIFCWKPSSIEEADLEESFEAYGAVDSVISQINLQEEVKDSVLLRCQMMMKLKSN
jgi:hypothetical protein